MCRSAPANPSITIRAAANILILLLFVIVCAKSFEALAQPNTGTPNQDVAAPAEKVLVERSTDDIAINKRLTGIFDASGWFRDLEVQVREGIAILGGVTDLDRHREWAGNVAAKTEGVVAVVNRITVKPEVSWNFNPAWQEITRLATKTQQALPLLAVSLVILFAAWQLARATARFARWSFRERISSPLMLMVTARLFAIPVFILGLYLVLQISGLTRLALTVLGGTGLIGIVLGFAFRDIAENFLASLLLSVRNPFRAGDLIQLGEHEGIVKNLNTRTTVLLTIDGNHVQIPNATIFKSVITNYSTNPSRRADFVVGIGYDDPTSVAQSIIEKVLDRHPAVRNEPPPFVVVDQLAASTVNLRVFFWFDSTTYSPVKLSSALMRQSKQALLDGGISLPDEAREVIFPEGVPLIRKQSEEFAKKPRTKTAQAQRADAADATEAEGGLDNEDDDVIREAGAAASPEEKENLLVDKPQLTTNP